MLLNPKKWIIFSQLTLAVMLVVYLIFPQPLALTLLALAVLSSFIMIFYYLYISKRILADLTKTIRSITLNDLSYRSGYTGIEEFDLLALSLNSVIRRLDEEVTPILIQQKEHRAILSGISEGLIAVDVDQRIIEINKTAGDLFKLDSGQIRNKLVPAVIRNSELQNLVTKVIHNGRALNEELILEPPLHEKKIYVRVAGDVITDNKGGVIGAVFIFNEITRIRRLEEIRRDFVANVSHELKTPITSIKGFVETILSGAVKSDSDLKKFLTIIEKHTNRLSAIIDDLLTLAQLEEVQKSKSDPISKDFYDLQIIVNNIMDLCEPRAKSKNIKIKYEFDALTNYRIFANRSLIEQALINIIDNAIKYSESNTEVCMSIEATDTHFEFRVKDQGPGIPTEHHERIFERFYRTDKARSRSEGGTGLGLAIVKHIAVVHGGSVKIFNNSGKGSTFSLTIPIA